MIFWLLRASNSRQKVNRGLFFLLFSIAFFGGYAQQTDKILQGKVVSPSKDVTGVTIQNISSQRASITDFDGNFSIRVQVGDTLIFSAVQLKRKVVPVSQALMDSPFVQIPMEEFVNELREVTVQPFGLSGDISKDLSGLQLEKDVSAEALGLPNADQKIPTQSERKLYEADHGKFLYLGLGFAVNINKILNRLTGRTKRLKRNVAVDRKYAQTRAVQETVEDSIFLRELNIPQTRLDDFMYFCEVDEEFQQLVAEGDPLLLWEYLRKRSKVYRKNNGLD